MGNEELVALAADARSRLGTDLPCRTHNKLGYVGYQVIIIGQQQLQRGSLKVNEAEQGNGCSQFTMPQVVLYSYRPSFLFEVTG